MKGGQDKRSLLLYLGGAIALAAAAYAGGVGRIDGFVAAQALAGQLPPAFWESLTVFGDERVLLALVLPFCWRYPRAFWALVLAALIAGLACRGVKIALALPRPAAVIPPDQITVIGHRLLNKSMPAGHAASAFAFAGVLLGICRRPAAWAALALAAGVAYSRVAVGAHWPLDTMVGAVFGLVGAWLGLAASERWDWGTRPRPFRFMLALAVVAVVSLPFDDQGYPGSLALRVALCLWGLAGLAVHRPGARRPAG